MSTMFAKVVYRPHSIKASLIQDIPGKEQTYVMKIFLNVVRVNLAWVGWSQQIDPSPRPPPLD
jgi:hypothetical protein